MIKNLSDTSNANKVSVVIKNWPHAVISKFFPYWLEYPSHSSFQRKQMHHQATLLTARKRSNTCLVKQPHSVFPTKSQKQQQSKAWPISNTAWPNSQHPNISQENAIWLQILLGSNIRLLRSQCMHQKMPDERELMHHNEPGVLETKILKQNFSQTWLNSNSSI